VLLLVFTGVIYGSEIKGTVVSLEKGDPVMGARISFADTDFVTFSDEKGSFVIKNLRLNGNKAILTVEAKGFITTTQPVEPGNLQALTVKMPEDRLLKYNIIVSATKTSHTVGDVPVESKVVTAEEIKEKNITNIQDVFAYLGGVQVSRGDNGWVRGAVRIQGMEDSHTLVLVNGQEYKGGIGGLDISTLNVNAIERIEVVKGPSSVLYGSDAIGGVINVITKSPLLNRNSLHMSAGFGSDNKQDLQLNGNYNRGNLGFRINVNRKHQDGLVSETDENVTDTIIGGEFVYKPNKHNQFNIISSFEHSKQEKADQWSNRYSFAGNWEWNNRMGSLLKVRASFFRDNYENSEEGRLWNRDFSEMEVTGSRLLFKNNLFTGGYRLRYERQDDPSKTFLSDQFMHSLYLQDEIELTSLTVVLGGRVDFHKEWGSQFTPKVNVMVSPFPNWKIRASAGRAFKAPSLQRLYAPPWIMGKSTLVLPNPDLKPEESVGYQLGLEWSPTKNVNVKGSFFLNNLNNKIANIIDRTKNPREMVYYNIEEMRSKGFELSLETYLGFGFKLLASHTYVDSENLTDDEPILLTPDHSSVLGLHWASRDYKYRVALDGRYIGHRFDSVSVGKMKYETVTLDPYFTLDLSVTAKVFEGLSLFLRLDNITGHDDIYDEYWLDGIKVFSGLSYRFD
jgi:outer membrane receptor for ferrienterochelin and colicins